MKLKQENTKILSKWLIINQKISYQNQGTQILKQGLKYNFGLVISFHLSILFSSYLTNLQFLSTFHTHFYLIVLFVLLSWYHSFLAKGALPSETLSSTTSKLQ